MNQIDIIQIGPHEFRVSGKCTFLHYNSKSVTVDGEVYSKEWYTDVEVDIDKLWNETPDKFFLCEIDEFVFLGLPIIKFWNYECVAKYARTGSNRSDNDYVNIIQALSHLGFIPFNLYNGKDWHYVTSHGFPVHIYSYGFNNSIYIYLSYQDIIRLSIPNHKFWYRHEHSRFFPNEWQKFSETQKSELLINYINNLNEKLLHYTG